MERCYQSDEISLLFDSNDTLATEHIFNGRVFKIVSIISSYISVRFNYHTNSNTATFDGRILTLKGNVDEYFTSRIKNGYNNCISAYKRAGIKDDIPDDEKYGVFCKIETYNKEGFNPKTEENVLCVRSRVIFSTFEPTKQNYNYFLP